MGVEKLTRFRSKLDVLRSERERLAAEMKKLTRQIREIDDAIQNCLKLRAEDLEREKQEGFRSVSRKKK